MTIPRVLDVRSAEGGLCLTSEPIGIPDRLRESTIDRGNIEVKGSPGLSTGYRLQTAGHPYQLHLEMAGDSSFSILLSNNRGEQVMVGYDKVNRQYYIDRSRSGITGFHKAFGRRYTAPRISTDRNPRLILLVDVSSLELFADGGRTVMTTVFFPEHPLDGLQISSQKGVTIRHLSFSAFRSIW